MTTPTHTPDPVGLRIDFQTTHSSVDEQEALLDSLRVGQLVIMSDKDWSSETGLTLRFALAHLDLTMTRVSPYILPSDRTCGVFVVMPTAALRKHAFDTKEETLADRLRKRELPPAP